MKALLGPRSRAIAVAALVVLGLTGAGLAVSPLLASQTAPAAPPAGQGKLVVYGDVTLFYPPPHPDNCVLRNRFKRGEPVGFRMFVADPSTGGLEESAKLVVHVTVGGMNVDIPMRYRATAAQPERQFWVAKWVVPQDAPVGVVRYTVTATDKYGRQGSFKPFEVQASQVTVVE